MSEISDRAEAKFSELKTDLLKANPNILDQYPIETSISRIVRYPDFISYKCMISSLEKLQTELITSYSKNAARQYHRMSLAHLIKESEPFFKKSNFPESIVPLYEKWFQRILHDLNTQPDEYYHRERDLFLKDLAVCAFRMIPVGGAWCMEIGSASKRALISNGILSYPGNIAFHIIKQKGLKPYYVIHTFDRYIMRFTPEEMEKAYLRIAEMLKQNPKIKGIYRSSWFLDPEIDRISPKLSFLRQIPAENGARFFKTYTRDLDIQHATSNSPERKQLYDEGKYTPTCWGYVWPRDTIIKWAATKQMP